MRMMIRDEGKNEREKKHEKILHTQTQKNTIEKDLASGRMA